MEIERLPEFSMIISSWDTSLRDGGASDYVSGQVWGIPRSRPADRYLLRLFHERAGLNATIEAMLTLHAWVEEHWTCPHYVLIENSANGPDAIAEIKGRVPGVHPFDARGTKEVRAAAAQPYLDGRNCYVPGYVNEEGTNYDPRTPYDVQQFIEELAAFGAGHQHDDQVDAWSQMINWSRKHGKRTASVSVPKGLKPRPVGLPR
jgi:predicted phage terminase large subunit-like protein